MNKRLPVCAALATLAGIWVVALLTASGAAASAPALPSSDPFYSYSGSLTNIAPGSVLRTRAVSLAESGSTTPATATQVLYRTVNEAKQPSVTVATVIRPVATVGTPKIVSYQTAYDALGSQCDPSYTLQGGNSSYQTAQEEEQIILGYVSAGYTVVVPDYEGEHLDWAAGQESGYDTLDGIRATENLLGAPAASTPVGVVGYSGGSIATEFASELAPTYSPELDIVGVAEGGVPVDFFHNLSYINGSPDWSGVIPAVLVSLSRAFGVSFEPYLSPYGVQVTNQVKDECINDFVGNYPGLTIQKLVKPQYANPDLIPDFVRIGDELIMSRTGTPKGPLFIGVGNADGTGDGVMVAKDVQELAYTYCRRGVSVQFNEYNGDDHDNAAIPFETGALQFLSDRLSGQAVSNGCSSIGPGNSLAPLAVPAGAKAKPPPKLKFRDLGRVKRLHGVDIKLWASGGNLNKLVVSFNRGHKRLHRYRIARLTGRKHRIVLRVKGKMPSRGRYTLKVTQGSKTMLKRTLKVR
ncbi:MAG: lipase family protein [Solirubrobacteraceae bacterium]